MPHPCGSHSSLIAAALLQRRYIGIELEEKYCDLARRRLAGVERYLATPRREPQREQRSMDGRPRRIYALQGGPR
jgi:DNA modification methylase